MMNENLNEMISKTNSTQVPPVMSVEPDAIEVAEKEATTADVVATDEKVIGLVKFYDWFEKNSTSINSVARVQAAVSNVSAKDAMIFKIKKPNAKSDDESSMELVSFYNPAARPIPNLPPVYLKIYKNDTFEALLTYNDEIFIKAYGVKNGLILVVCVNVDGKVVPVERLKIKKDATEVKMYIKDGISTDIKAKLSEAPDVENISLLYKQASKSSAEFTTKETTLDWFLKKQAETIDINHLLKIDGVLINTVSSL